ncbi:hypothetical protein OTU49_000686 [Cherax quadricarinatus]|uniref:DUF4592 domain-containing protein n=2 Tax=Cherax quadricarinatus TaxID=27406 RepID=A0AAW0YE24_CHEQU
MVETDILEVAELKAALRRRRGEDSGSGDDDPGLPRSPPTSPTTLDVLNHGLKSCSRATHSTCSDGSLLSMGSSENDEDSLGAGSHHSSKVSLLEGRHQVVDNEPVVGAVRLSHQAAFHKIAVRPRRTHGAPRSRRPTQIGGQISLPDVIEEANNKNSTSQKTSNVPAASASSSKANTHTDIVEELSSTSIDSQTIVEHDSDKKEKDKEDKRDEPLFQRLFGSKRSGRRQSRGSGDDSRENSVSPMRHGGDQRASREKRRDSSGSRFPVIGVPASKIRQDSHPLPPSGRPREPSKERLAKEVSSSQTLFSASVEGSLESTLIGHQPNFHISPYDERPIRLSEGVRKVKSFREVPEQNVTREVFRRKVSSQTNVEDQNSVPTKISRISASLESLDSEEVTRKSSALHAISYKTIQNETLSSSQRSSTDSLTTTPLPGVFIRQHSQNHNKTLLQKHQDHLQQLHNQQLFGQEVSSGPFSLDSSISSQSRESEDMLRKVASVDHMICSVEIQHLAKESETKESIVTKPAEVKAITESAVDVIEGKTESGKLEGKTSPNQILHSHSIHKDEETVIQVVNPVESEVEGEYVPRRPLRKEPSMKRLLPRDPEPTPVPEFMRIQLNRVESKGQSVIYDTEQERNTKNDKKDVEILSKKPEAVAVAESIQREAQISECPIETSVILKKEVSNIPSSKDNKLQTSASFQKSTIQGSRGLFRDTSPSGNNTESGDGDSGTEGTLSDTSVEHVILRKPLVSERAPIIERASSVTNQMPLLPSSREQPELFKVFARRSFKVKDSDKGKPESSDNYNDETDVEASSEVSEVTISPVRTHSSPSSVSIGIGSSLTSVSTAQSLTEGLQKPSIHTISFNRRSVGNPTLSFCPPPASTPDAPVGSPLSSKPMVLVLSSNNITVTSSSEITITSSSRNITAVTSTTNIITTCSSQSIPSTMPILVTAARPLQTTTVVPAASESSITVSTTPPTGIISKIISNRVSSVTSLNDSGSGIESENSSSSSLIITSTPSKPTLSSRSGSGILWPPRLCQEQDESPQSAHQTQIPIVMPSIPVSQQKKLSLSSLSDFEVIRDSEQIEETEVEISPLDIGAARRRFMSGGKDRPRAPVTPPAQNLLPAATSPASGTSPSGSTSNSLLGTQSSIIVKSGPSVTEARNTPPSFTITVRTQAAPSPSRSDNVPAATTSVTSSTTDLNSSTTSTNSTTSIGKPEQGTTQQATEDWRVLVRQRREDRLKQTKTPDSEEIIIETRPPVSRNSKVLEMANNFQKLQVA